VSSFRSHKKTLFAAFGAVSAAALYLFLEPWLPLHLHCLFKRLTGVPCPGCGTVRSLHLLMQGDVAASLLTNPLGLLLVLLLLSAAVLLVRDAWRNDDLLYRLMHRRWPPATLAAVAIFTLANWIWNIGKGL